MNTNIPWHRLFGIALIDLFEKTDYLVELEKDLSIKQQYLDIAIIRQQGDQLPHPLPDGLDNLRPHNLLTYKSLHESMNAWAIEELIGHYTNYRKISSPDLKKHLLPEDHFQLYAISTRYPAKLLKDPKHFKKQQAGVMDLHWGHRTIRLIILSQLPETPQNAFWQLFAGIKDKFRYGRACYLWNDPNQQTILNQLDFLYDIESDEMPYTKEDFQREFTEQHLHLLSPEQLLDRLSPEQLLERLSPEQLLDRLSTEQRLKDLSPEQRLKDLSPEQRLKDLSATELKQLFDYLQQLNISQKQ